MNGYVYDFSVDYDAIAVGYILEILTYFLKKNNMTQKMFTFIEKAFVVTMSSFSWNAQKCVSTNNQKCKVIPEIININSNEPVFYRYSVKMSNCSGSCNNINGPYAKLCVRDVSKNMNVKVFNVISRTNKTRYIKWHENCKYKCRLDASVCKINADVNAKNWLTKEYVIKDLFGTQVTMNVNLINHVMLENNEVIKTISAEKS